VQFCFLSFFILLSQATLIAMWSHRVACRGSLLAGVARLGMPSYRHGARSAGTPLLFPGFGSVCRLSGGQSAIYDFACARCFPDFDGLFDRPQIRVLPQLFSVCGFFDRWRSTWPPATARAIADLSETLICRLRWPCLLQGWRCLPERQSICLFRSVGRAGREVSEANGTA